MCPWQQNFHACVDEDIPTTTTTSPTLHDEQANQIRLGPITRARAKLLEQQVNLLLLESDDRLSENYILPKSLYVCMIRYQSEDKELGEAEVQGEEAKEQGQATSEKESQEDKAKKIPASGRGTTALAAVLPRGGTNRPYYRKQHKVYGSEYGTTIPYYREQQKVYGSEYCSRCGTTAPAVVPRQSRYYRAS